MKWMLCACFVVSTVRAQYFQFDTIKAHDAWRIEKTFNSLEEHVEYKVGVAEDYFPGARTFTLAQPLMFIRPDSTWKPDPEVNYFFSESDSIVRLLDYTWNAKKITKLADVLSSSKQVPQIQDYDEKYFYLRSLIVSALGVPTDANDTLHTKKEEDREWQERSAKWKTERCTVELTMTWAPPSKYFGTYRIRVKIY